jgi:hypothetical protein
VTSSRQRPQPHLPEQGESFAGGRGRCVRLHLCGGSRGRFAGVGSKGGAPMRQIAYTETKCTENWLARRRWTRLTCNAPMQCPSEFPVLYIVNAANCSSNCCRLNADFDARLKSIQL